MLFLLDQDMHLTDVIADKFKLVANSKWEIVMSSNRIMIRISCMMVLVLLKYKRDQMIVALSSDPYDGEDESLLDLRWK